MAYFGLNYAFLSDQSYDSMKDYIETTKNEFSYEDCGMVDDAAALGSSAYNGDITQ